MILNRKSPDVFKDVTEFMEIAQPDMIVEEGIFPTERTISLAIKLIDEECNKEYIPALHKYQKNPTQENLIAVIDGAMDSIYVIAWAMRAFNVPAQAMWNEVQRSNMAKFKTRFDVSHLMDGADTIPPKPHKDTDPTIDIEIRAEGEYWVLRNTKTGKVVKPAGWTQPDLFGVLHEHNSIHLIKTQRGGQIAQEFLKDYFLNQEDRRDHGKTIDI